ncbi:hypothetical protein C8Q80DRAFT_1144630 [Daedaleopsis nitida]|nr:hypothetical protein C8Q80DRAFT_1144630 [Daedaleopsis nitida]
MTGWSGLADSDDEYEPSQVVPWVSAASPTSRLREAPPRRARSSAASEALVCLYGPGGALDSQTSDTQWEDTILNRSENTAVEEQDSTLLDDDTQAAYQIATSEEQTGTFAFTALQDENQALRCEVARLTATYNAVSAHLSAVRSMANDLPIVLDDQEESQVALELPLTWPPVVIAGPGLSSSRNALGEEAVPHMTGEAQTQRVLKRRSDERRGRSPPFKKISFGLHY